MVDKLMNSEANYNRIKRVEECFGKFGKPLLNPGRVLIGEGVLRKMCRKGLKERIFFLFNDILLYGNIIVQKRLYNKQHIIQLEDIKLESLENTEGLENGWLIKTSYKSFKVFSNTNEEKEEWMSFIQKSIDYLVYKMGRKAATKFAAVWVPDIEAEICMCCKIYEFTVFNRRHHCRNCGNVVCGPCSENRFVIPLQSQRPSRVCLECSFKLSQKQYKNVSERNQLNPIPMNCVQISDSNHHSEEEIYRLLDQLNYNTIRRRSIFYGHRDLSASSLKIDI